MLGSIVAALFCVGLLVSFAYAAMETVDSSVGTSVSEGASRTVVFVSDTNGYVFYTDSSGACVFSKTTNGGASWGAAVTVDSQTDCFRITVWYDRWTPGDTSGTLIHISTLESGGEDMYYTQLQTSNDSVSTPANASGAGQGGSLNVGENFNSIAKGTDGDLYMGVSDSSDSYVIKCTGTCTTAGNWSEAGTNPLDTADEDTLMLVPLASGNLLLVNHDVSANVLRSKVWTDSSASWASSWSGIDTAVDENTTYEGDFSVAADPDAAGTVYLAYLDDVGTLDGDDDDIKTGLYTGSWATTTTASVWTNATTSLTNVSIGIAGSTVYVAYASAPSGTAADNSTLVFWATSTPAMTKWTTHIGPPTDNYTSAAITNLNINASSDERLLAAWRAGSVLYGATIVDVVPTSDASYIKLTGAVMFLRDLVIVSSLSKSYGTFVIDHPQRPRTHLLYHSFVESPDVKNVYDGVATLGGNGEAEVELPSYFEALNKDFRYQFFALDQAMPNLYIKQEVKKNRFTIAGGEPNGRVSWQVTGIRHDPYILANPIRVEVPKGPGQVVGKGKCIFEPLCI